MAWDEIIGQDLAKRRLQIHLAAGRVAQAYLLVGPDGVGKRRLAIEMAKALTCAASGARPCDECASCRQVSRLTHPDIHVVSPGGSSEQIKIDDIRYLLGRLVLKPFSASTQVAVIDGAERLTEEAANSLLKSLEEPSSSSRFLLTTARLPQCLPTVVSRCQMIRCEPLSAEVLRRILIEGQGCDPRMAQTIARLSGGSASRAIDLAGRWVVYQNVLEQLASEGPSWLEQPLPETRQEVTQLLDGMMAWLRDVAVAAVADPAQVRHAEHLGALRRQANAIDVDRCLETALELIDLRESVEQFVSPRLIAALAREKWLSLLCSSP